MRGTTGQTILRTCRPQARAGRTAVSHRLVNHLDAITAPLLLIGGERNPRRPPRQLRKVAEKLRARGDVCDLIIYADEGHEISGLEHRVDYDRRTMGFILEHTGAPA